jgi:hypothetical protein
MEEPDASCASALWEEVYVVVLCWLDFFVFCDEENKEREKIILNDQPLPSMIIQREKKR